MCFFLNISLKINGEMFNNISFSGGVKINLINLLHGVFKNIYGHENGGYLFLLKKAPRGDIEK